MNVVADKTYPEMFYIQWPDGSLSDDFYNISRAQDFARRIAETTSRNERGMGGGAH